MGGELIELTFAELVGGRENVIGGPFGSNLTSADYVSGGMPIIRGSNMSQAGRYIGGEFVFVSPTKASELAQNQVCAGDLIVTQRGTLGQISIVPQGAYQKYIISQSQMGVRVQGADPLFVYYLLLSPYFSSFIDGAAIQTGVPHINLGVLRDWRVRVPSHRNQSQISAVLGALDDKIELNRRMAETLEAKARALFKSWFVDFDPVRAKVEARPTGLPESIAELFPDSFDDDGLPDGWTAGKISDLASLNPESWTAVNRPAQLQYVDLANTKWGRIELVQTFDAPDAPSRAQRVLRPGDTIVGTVRPGNGAYARIGKANLTGSTGFAVLRPTRTRDSALVYLAATSKENIETLASLADGGAYPAVRPSLVADTPFVIASKNVRDEFSEVVTALCDGLISLDEQSRTLAALRDALLPQLISGKLRIRDAEHAVAAA